MGSFWILPLFLASNKSLQLGHLSAVLSMSIPNADFVSILGHQPIHSLLFSPFLIYCMLAGHSSSYQNARGLLAFIKVVSGTMHWFYFRTSISCSCNCRKGQISFLSKIAAILYEYFTNMWISAHILPLLFSDRLYGINSEKGFYS